MGGYRASLLIFATTSASTDAQMIMNKQFQRYFLTPLLLCLAMAAGAQTETTAPTLAKAAPDTLYMGPAGYLPYEPATTLNPAPPYAYSYGGLHPGLNASLDLSVFSEFGKNARRGAGFTQSLSATYLSPLGRRSWLAVGGDVSHINWSGDSYATGGLHAELGYIFNDHWSASLYGRKSIVNNGLGSYGYGFGRGMYPYGSPYLYNGLGDKLGAAVRWTPNPSLSLEVSVEKDWYPTPGNNYPDRYQYNYPVPK